MNNPSSISDIKARELASWNAVAAGWARHADTIARLYSPVTQRMFERVGLKERQRVLDIACGVGDPAIDAARRVGRLGRVLGMDLSEDMVNFAVERSRALDLTNIDFQQGDAETMQWPGNVFNVCTMRWGLMFMPEPVRCLATAHSALQEGGKIVLSCWASPEKNPWAAIPMSIIKKYVDVPPPAPGATGIFAFADPERIRAVMTQAGFRNIEIEAFDVQGADAESGAAFFSILREIAGPLATLLARASAQDQATIGDEVARAAQAASTIPGRVCLPGVTWIATGEV